MLCYDNKANSLILPLATKVLRVPMEMDGAFVLMHACSMQHSSFLLIMMMMIMGNGIFNGFNCYF
jgi:hypothetical protein